MLQTKKCTKPTENWAISWVPVGHSNSIHQLYRSEQIHNLVVGLKCSWIKSYSRSVLIKLQSKSQIVNVSKSFQGGQQNSIFNNTKYLIKIKNHL